MEFKYYIQNFYFEIVVSQSFEILWCKPWSRQVTSYCKDVIRAQLAIFSVSSVSNELYFLANFSFIGALFMATFGVETSFSLRLRVVFSLEKKERIYLRIKITPFLNLSVASNWVIHQNMNNVYFIWRSYIIF